MYDIKYSETQAPSSAAAPLGLCFWVFLGLKAGFFKLLHAKPCRIIWKFNQQLSFGTEMCEIGPELCLRSCPDLLFNP